MRTKNIAYFYYPAFTLVELIVVLAVLAVLASIAFSTVSNVSSSARDSARLTDVSSIKTSLETYSATKGALPIPDNAVAITWSGASAWSQWTFGDNTARQLGNISKPKDPKWANEYTYSLANNKREYEVATVLEKATSLSPLSSAYAAGESYDPTIKGNYNGIAIKTQSGSSVWILSVPTIIAGDVKDANLANVILSFSKSGNIPASYVGKMTSSQPNVSFSASQVWSGAELPKKDSEYSAFTLALQNAYSGSVLVSNNSLTSLLTTTNTSQYGNDLISRMGGAIQKWGTIDEVVLGGAGTSSNPWKRTNGASLASCKEYNDAAISNNTGNPRWTGSCGATKTKECLNNGVYSINPTGTPFLVYCDMTTDGGGWTLITSVATTMPTIASMQDVTNATLITPNSGNVTNRNMRLPNPTEMLAVSLPGNPTYYKAEKITGVSGISLTWQEMIDALNKNTGATYWDRNYTTGSDDPWRVSVTRVNTTGCMQTPLRWDYGDGNYIGFNGGGADDYAWATKGWFFWHWGMEYWIGGMWSGHPGRQATSCDSTQYDTTNGAFWQGMYLR